MRCKHTWIHEVARVEYEDLNVEIQSKCERCHKSLFTRVPAQEFHELLSKYIEEDGKNAL